MAIVVNNAVVRSKQGKNGIQLASTTDRKNPTHYTAARDAAADRIENAPTVVVNGKARKLNKTSAYLLDMLSTD